MGAELAALKLALWVAGGIISLLIGALATFVWRVINDVKSNTEKIGTNKGEIELVSQRQIQDVKRIEENTQLEIRQLAREISTLTTSVQALVEIQMKNSK